MGGIGFVNGNLLDIRGHLLVGFYILGETVDAGGAEQLQASLRQLVFQKGGTAEQCTLLIEQLVNLLNDQHGILQCLHLIDNTFEAVFHLAFVLGIAT